MLGNFISEKNRTIFGEQDKLENIDSNFVVNIEDTVFSALEKIDINQNNFVVCVDSNKDLQGVLTDGDIRRHLLNGETLETPISSCMAIGFECLDLESDFQEIANKFKSSKIKFLPIVDSSRRLVNILTKKQFHVMLLEDIKLDLLLDFSVLDKKSIDHEVFNKPWGFYKSTIYTEMAQAKILTVFPKGILSLQKHKHREEHWVIIKGKGQIVLGESVLDVYPGKYVYVPKGCKHRIMNNSETENLIFSEVQLGNYFGEDDIVRYSDEYNRTTESQ